MLLLIIVRKIASKNQMELSAGTKLSKSARNAIAALMTPNAKKHAVIQGENKTLYIETVIKKITQPQRSTAYKKCTSFAQFVSDSSNIIYQVLAIVAKFHKDRLNIVDSC